MDIWLYVFQTFWWAWGRRMDHQKMYEPKPLVSEKHRALANRHTGWISGVHICLRHKIQGLGLNMGYVRMCAHLMLRVRFPHSSSEVCYQNDNRPKL